MKKKHVEKKLFRLAEQVSKLYFKTGKQELADIADKLLEASRPKTDAPSSSCDREIR